MYILILISDGIHKTYFNAHEILLTYKIQALKNILKARQTLKKTINDKNNVEKRKTTTRKDGEEDKSSELTLIMLFPLIEYVAETDQVFCSKLTKAIFGHLDLLLKADTDTMIRTLHLVLFNLKDMELNSKNLLIDVQKLDYEQPQLFDVSRHEFGFHYNSRYIRILAISFL